MLCDSAVKHQDIFLKNETWLLVLFLANWQNQSKSSKYDLLTIMEDNSNPPQTVFPLISITYILSKVGLYDLHYLY